jgi:hypothetical protein
MALTRQLGHRMGQLALVATLATAIATVTLKPAAADDDGNHRGWYGGGNDDDQGEWNGSRGVYVYGGTTYYAPPPSVYYAPPPTYYYPPPPPVYSAPPSFNLQLVVPFPGN